MKVLSVATLFLLVPMAAGADSARTPEQAAADLGRLIHQAIVAKLPPVIEDSSGWGHTIPLPDRVLLPRLRRTLVPVGERMEVPDGPWRRVRVRVEDPQRDLQVRVRSFKRLQGMTYRVQVETDVALRAEADLQAWRYGLLLTDLTARADVALTVLMECDMVARLEAGRLPPRLLLEPDVRDLKLNLTEFTPRQVTFRRAGVTVQGTLIEAAGEEFKDALQALLRNAEPAAMKRTDAALAQALKEGKEPLTPARLLRTISPLLREK